MNTEHAGIIVGMVVGCGIVDPVKPIKHSVYHKYEKRRILTRKPNVTNSQLPVEHIEVEASVHALAGAPSWEWATATHEHVEYAEGNEIGVFVGTAFQSYYHVSQLRHGVRAKTDVR